MDCSIPGFRVLHYLLEFAQTYVPWVGDTIQSSQPLAPPSPLAVNLSQHQGFFSKESALCIRWPKYWSFSFSISPSNEYSGLISFRGLQITADGDYSHKTKRCLLLGRKVRTNLDSILKSRDITLLTKVHIVKAIVFRVVMYGCESWTIKKGEYQRIDAFELWCWRRLLRVPWTARRSN